MKNLPASQLLAFILLGLMTFALRFVMGDITCCDDLYCGGGAVVQIDLTAGCGTGVSTNGYWSDAGVGCGNHTYQHIGTPVMRSINDIAYATVSGRCPTGHCDTNGWHWDDCGPTSFSISPGLTGCKITLITNLCGSRQWMISEPKHSGVVTVTASVSGSCSYGGPDCSLGQETYTAVGTLQVDLGDGGGGGGWGCPGCGGPKTLGSGHFVLVRLPWDGWVLVYKLYLGYATPGLDAGYIHLTTSLSPAAAQPVQLEVPFARPGVEVIPQAGSSTIRQVKIPQGLVNVRAINDHQYQLEVFSTNNVTGIDGNGYYGTNGPAFVTWVVENPGGAADTNHLNITELRGGTQRVFQNTCTAASNRLDLVQPDGQTIESVWTVADGGNTNVTNYVHQVSSGGQVLKQTVETFEFIPGLDYALLEQEVEGTGAATRTNHYVYYSANPTNGASTNLLRRADYWDGAWTYYQYDELGRVATTYSAYGTNAPPTAGTTPEPSLCKVTEYKYSLEQDVDGTEDDGTLYPFTARRTTVKVPVAGTPREIARTYHKVYSESWEETQECPDPEAQWGAAGNLRSATFKDSQGHVLSTLSPDGTGTVYTYQDDYTTIVQTGQPDNSNLPGQILAGTTATTVVDELGLVQSTTDQDIATSVVLSSQTYNYKDSGGNYLDPLRRSHDVTDLAGRTTQYRYSDCCGLDYVIDPDGVQTYYEYDPVMKRQIGTRQVTAAGGIPLIEVTNRLDSLGRALATMRVGRAGTNAFVITERECLYDVLGQIIAETNALRGATLRSNFVSSAGQRIWTNTYPDGGTRVEIYNRDGRLAEVLGTAVHPVRYLYGAEQDGTLYRAYSEEIKLKADGSSSSEWSRTYTDALGRIYKTTYAPRPGVDSSPPFNLSLYNEYGQRWQQIDPDGVITLYTYDAQGQQEYTITLTNDTWVPSDYGTLVTSLDDLKAGSDRITQVQRSVVAPDDARPHRTRVDTLVWDDGQQTGTLVSRSETSTNGLDSWQMVYRASNTPVVTHTQTAYGGSGGRTETTVAPDSSYTISAYSHGRLSSVVRYNSQGDPVSTLAYSYDPHGRQSTVTDARNGTTTSTFNDADLVVSVTTPSPGPGQVPQTTTTSYNTMLQATNVVQPDGASVTTEYYLTGELKRQYGARTYPIAYSYDYAGRMQTMTNWSGFPSVGARVTTWNYNTNRGWLDSKRYPDAGTGNPSTVGPDYTYTPAGRLQQRTWARGNPRLTTTFAYDGAGGLATVTYNDGATDASGYTYDRRGRQATITQGGMTNTLAYNSADQMLSESYSGGLLAGLSVTNGYDPYLRRSQLAALNSTTPFLQHSFSYDDASRLQVVADSTGANTYSATYAYLANSPLVHHITFKQATTTRMTTTNQYDYLDRLTSISSSPSSSSSTSYAYSYNNANQRIRSTLADGSYWLYEYDSLGQVRSGHKFWSDQTPVAGQQFEYSHDDIGNRTSTKAGGDQNGGHLRSAGYLANNLNQYTTRDVPGAVDIMGLALATNLVQVNNQDTYRKGEYFRKELAVDNASVPVWQTVSVTAANETPVSGGAFVPMTPEQFYYDADGNLTNDGRWTYIWDAENRLVKLAPRSAVGPQNSIKFEYDWQGRRIHKQVWANTNWYGTPTNDLVFVYDGWNLIAELDALDASTLLRSYVWGNDLSGTMQGAGGIGGLLFIGNLPSPIGYCAPAYDGNGNVAALVSMSGGTNCATYEYGPFGEGIRATGSMAKPSPFRFSTKYQDDETDLLYYGYRYYNPTAARWLNRDPLGQPGGHNAYAFVRNNSTGLIDRLGLYARSKGCSFGQLLQLLQAEESARAGSASATRELDQSFGGFSVSQRHPDFKAKYFATGHNPFKWTYIAWHISATITFQRINRGFNANTYDVKCECRCKESIYAYTLQPIIGEDNSIHFCPAYFNQLDTASQADTYLHEASHLFADTDDLAQGGGPPWELNPRDAYWIENVASESPFTFFDAFIVRYTKLFR